MTAWQARLFCFTPQQSVETLANSIRSDNLQRYCPTSLTFAAVHGGSGAQLFLFVTLLRRSAETRDAVQFKRHLFSVHH